MKGSLPSLTCPNCSHENLEDAKFCQNCGLPLARTCTECGTANEVDAKFCRNCGKSLEQPPTLTTETRLAELQQSAPEGLQERIRASSSQIEGERKPVTILFADIVGSTSLAEKLDPEVWKEIVSGAHRRVGEAIYRYEGTIAQLLGDGVLAFFGAPITHEDDPIRAVRAALDVQESIQDYEHELKDLVDSFQMRVGINTGEVVIGNIGTDMHMEYLAIGDAVNLAARLQSAAEPGKAILSGSSARLLGDTFDLKSLGEITVKGKEEPVEIFEIVGINLLSEQRRSIQEFKSPFVDREDEEETLRSSLLRLCEDHGQIVSVIGEAGIGKSRLVAEVRESLWEEDPEFENLATLPASIRWLEGRALSYGGSLSYWTITQLLLADLGLTNGASQVKIKVALRQRLEDLFSGEQSSEVMPYVTNLLGIALDGETKDRIENLDGKTLKKETHHFLQAYFTQLTKENPTVLVIEDMHWSDPSSLEVLEDLFSLTDHVPLLILMLMRTEREHGSWKLRVMAETDFHHRYTDIHLRGLSEEDSSKLVDHLLGDTNVSEEIYTTILTRVEGNPFYIEEVVRHMIEEGMIARDEKGWHPAETMQEVGIPDTLQGVLLARIDRLEEDVRHTLQMASVIGKSFLYRILEAISEAERALDTHLSQLQRLDLIREKTRLPELEYIFKQTLTQEATYNSILHERRREFHLKVGEALERLFQDRVDEFLGLLAYHFEIAEDYKKAVDYMQRAGDQARLAYAHEEAIHYYEQAIDSLKEQGEYELAARTLSKLGLIYHTIFDFRQSRKAFQESFALWQQTGKAEIASLPPAPHAFREFLPDPITLDPGLCVDFGSVIVIWQLFSGLVELNQQMEIVPDVARSWEVSADGRKYVFHLREDVSWSDGTPVTAGDFEYAWKRVLDPTLHSEAAETLYDIDGARAFHLEEVSSPADVGIYALDSHTLVVELENPTAYFLHLLAGPTSFPIPRHVVKKFGENWIDLENIVTNGPFRLDDWEPGQRIVFSRNLEYHGRFTGNLEQVELQFFGHEAAKERLDLYEADDLDACRLPPEEMELARFRHIDEYVSSPFMYSIYANFDVQRPPFDDPRVRQAFVHAVDRETLADVVLRGYQLPATGGFVPPGVPGHSEGIGLPYNPELARALLSEAGFPGGQGLPSITFLSDLLTQNNEYLLAQWRDNLGVEIALLQFPSLSALLDDLHEKQSFICAASWVADYPDPDSFLRLCFAMDLTQWQNENFALLVEGARRVTDYAERIEMYRKADRILVEEAGIMPLLYGRIHYLVKPWVKKFPFSPMQALIYKDVIVEPH